MSLHFTLNQSTLTSFQQSTTPIAEKSSKTIPRKTTDLKNDSFEQQHSSTPKSTKPSANDGTGLMLIAGITTLLLVGGGLLAWYLSTKKGGKPFGNLPPKAGGEVGSKPNQAVTGGSSMGKTDKILTATELRTELENQLATIKANAEQWLSGQKQAVDDIRNRPLNNARTKIDTFFQEQLQNYHDQKTDLEALYRNYAVRFPIEIEDLTDATVQLVDAEDILQTSQEIQQLADQALAQIKGTTDERRLISTNKIIPPAFNRAKLQWDGSDRNSQIVGDDLNTQLNQFYQEFLIRVIEFNANTTASNKPERLMLNLTEQIKQLVKQSEVYKFKKALYDSIYSSS